MKPFFFLPDDHMPKVFSAIARLIYYSNGGFTFTELYEGMPVYVRRYMTDEISDIKQSEKEAMEDGNSSSSGRPPQDIGKAMEKLEKRADGENPFATGETTEEEKKNPQSEAVRQSTLGEKEESFDVPTEDDEDNSNKGPANAEDLNHLIDKLKQQ